MPKLTYAQLSPLGAVLIIAATSFGLGAAYAQLPYDVYTLWRKDESGTAFDKSLAHFQQWGNSPAYVHHILHGVMAIGLIGCFIKLYKPQPESKYFEYGTLVFYLAGIILYLTNLRVGVNSCLTGNWGEVDSYTGISVIAASTVLIVIVLVGVLVLQGGLYYAEWYDGEAQKEFDLKQKAEEAKEKVQVVTEKVKKGKSKKVD